MTVQDLSDARDRLRRTLPGTLRAALDAYDAFAARPVPADAREFGAWQGGCKAALGHVELLLKLGARVGLALSPPGATAGDTALADLLARARAAMAEEGAAAGVEEGVDDP
ncbi:hypothetical protein [Roseospira visakhapatnamensis]|uniref:Uncharacterized protein n=1 Tax=Roseospira visakhapatnamensis TaxID=390880 RepID=A0A7W6RD42_9PROT|nr:hypothetical protein [Roseospira visakhapatnamensis]MBB4266100.1 hypothetical protein [Roseospira visakhapatnamensis]